MQFGVMGSAYWKHVHGVERPRVGILSNGEETSKGTELTRGAAAALLQMAPRINCLGYVEGRDINHGRVDVIVTDGFTGNVALKTMEGFAAFLLGNLREVFDGSMLRRMAYLLVRKKLRAIRERLDPAEYGGAPLLGVNGVTIIAHGSSNARAIRNAIRAAANEALVRHVNAEIVESLADSPPGLIARPTGKGFRGLFLRMRDRLHLHRDMAADKKFEITESGDWMENARSAEASDAMSRGAAASDDEAYTTASANSRRKAAADEISLVNGVGTVATINSEVPGESRPAAETTTRGRPEKGSTT
jgi:hypothetical protein